MWQIENSTRGSCAGENSPARVEDSVIPISDPVSDPGEISADMLIQLGDRVRDRVSGFEGIVLARIDELYSATEFRVHSDDPAMNNGNIWVPAGRLEPKPKE